MTYTYVDPTTLGFREITISKAKHDSLFKNYQTAWNRSFRYYLSDHELRVHKFMSLPAVVLSVILFPVAVLMSGFPDAVWDIRRILRQRHYGSFSSFSVFDKNDMWDEISS